jgi:hypothetical protein
MSTTSAISLTLFNSIFDNKTEKRVDLKDFDSFERVLFDLSERKLATKKDAELMSPATYVVGTTRANDNVLEWSGWCAVDVDEFVCDGDLKDELYSRFPNFRFICYSTASSTIDFPKFRLVFPLTKAVRGDRIKKFWYALQTELGNLGDRQTKDLSRMYYIPANYAGANNFIFNSDAREPIDPDELIFKHPMPEKSSLNNFFDRLPESMQQQIVEHRKAKLDASFTWSSYHDCPFWPKNLAAEYSSISRTGWYHKMYQIMVAVAGHAIDKRYAITSDEVSQLCRQFDEETGNWYKNRPMDKEADRAIEYVYKNM